MRDDNFCGKSGTALSSLCRAASGAALGLRRPSTSTGRALRVSGIFGRELAERLFSADLLTTLHEWANTLRSAPPMEVKLRRPDPPVKLFTDGFCDCGSSRCCEFRCSHLGHVHRGRRIVLFVDDDAARYGCDEGLLSFGSLGLASYGDGAT